MYYASGKHLRGYYTSGKDLRQKGGATCLSEPQIKLIKMINYDV